MKLSEALTAVGGSCTLVQDEEFSILELCSRVRREGALTFLEKERFVTSLEHPNIACVICTPELRDKIPPQIKGVVLTENPKALFYKIHNLLAAKQERRPSQIDSTAKISPLAYIAPYNVIIGKNVEIQPFVTVGENTVIEEDVLICSGTIVGAQSFSPVPDGDKMFLAKDAGGTRIERGVEICGQCDIACGTLQLDTTVVGAYTKLDAKVHIGHGSVLGKRNRLPSGAHVAGNCIIGDDIWIGVNATISNRIVVGDGARVSLGSVVTKDVPAGVTVTGNFAIEHQQFLRNLKKSLIKEDSSVNGEQTPPPRTIREDLIFHAAPRDLQREAA